MDIRVGDIQEMHIDISGASLDKAKRVSVVGVNGDLKLMWPPEDVKLWWYTEDGPQGKIGDGGVKFKLDEDKAWALTAGIPLDITVKVNYMEDSDGDGKYAEGDPVADMYTHTIGSVRYNVLPSPFKRGDVDE